MPSRRKSDFIWRNKRSCCGIGFLLPSLLGVTLFVLAPFCGVVRRSFVTVLGERFTGLANYRTVLENKAFLLAAGNTLRFTALAVPLLATLSLLVAAMLFVLPGASRIFRVTFLLPMAVPAASVALLWQALFHKNGLVNGWLGTTTDFMGGSTAFWVLVGTFLWKNIGYDVVLWLAGLASVPVSIQEAARVDGAGPLGVFRHVTLPYLLPTLYTVTVLSLLGAFKVFREAYLVAGDYPDESIYLLQHLFNNWFRELSMDKLAAAAVLVALAVLALVLILRAVWEGKN